MPALRERLMASPPLKRKLFQVDFLATLSGRLMITLVLPPPARRSLGGRRT
jgi:tRNA (uracil-5-)-methyltransferase